MDHALDRVAARLGLAAVLDPDLLRAHGDRDRLVLAVTLVAVDHELAAEIVALHHQMPLVGLGHDAFEEVDRADEVGGEAGRGELVDVGRCPDLHDLAPVHDGDPGREGHGLFLVVGHHHEGDAEPLLDRHQLELGLLAQLLVERAERLVEQQHLGLLDQRAGQGNPLALPAGELVRPTLGEGRELHQVEHGGDPVGDLGLGKTIPLQAVGDVLLHGHVGEERVGLEHHVDRPLIGRQAAHILAIDEDAPRGRRLEAGQHAQQGGLAAAGAAQQAEQLAPIDLDVDVVDRGELAEALEDPLHVNEGLRPGV